MVKCKDHYDECYGGVENLLNETWKRCNVSFPEEVAKAKHRGVSWEVPEETGLRVRVENQEVVVERMNAKSLVWEKENFESLSISEKLDVLFTLGSVSEDFG